MPPFTYEYDSGIFFVKDTAPGGVSVRAFYPQDAQNHSAPVVMGFDYTTGKFVPISCTSDGKLDTTATLSGTVTLGAVTIEDRNSSTRLDIMKGDGTATFGLAGDHNQGLLAFGVGKDSKIRAFKQSDAGAISTDENIMNKENLVEIFSYTTVGAVQRVGTIKSYPQGAAGGSPAKLTTLTWNIDGTLATSTTTNTTV